MKIVVFRARQLGGMLCPIPAIRTLKQAFPFAKLLYIGLPAMRSLLNRYDFIDYDLDFSEHKGLPEQLL